MGCVLDKVGFWRRPYAQPSTKALHDSIKPNNNQVSRPKIRYEYFFMASSWPGQLDACAGGSILWHSNDEKADKTRTICLLKAKLQSNQPSGVKSPRKANQPKKPESSCPPHRFLNQSSLKHIAVGARRCCRILCNYLSATAPTPTAPVSAATNNQANW